MSLGYGKGAPQTTRAVFAILLLLQASTGIWVDGLTQLHYWNAERRQFEHLPPEALRVSHKLIDGDALATERAGLPEAPCPFLPYLLTKTLHQREAWIPREIGPALTRSGPSALDGRSPLRILSYAPKLSPP